MNLQWLEDNMQNGDRIELKKQDGEFVAVVTDNEGSQEYQKLIAKNHIEAMARTVQFENQIKNRFKR